MRRLTNLLFQFKNSLKGIAVLLVKKLKSLNKKLEKIKKMRLKKEIFWFK